MLCVMRELNKDHCGTRLPHCRRLQPLKIASCNVVRSGDVKRVGSMRNFFEPSESFGARQRPQRSMTASI
jgi:hypothetical protein